MTLCRISVNQILLCFSDKAQGWLVNQILYKESILPCSKRLKAGKKIKRQRQIENLFLLLFSQYKYLILLVRNKYILSLGNKFHQIH